VYVLSNTHKREREREREREPMSHAMMLMYFLIIFLQFGALIK
jgi:hypothetical protein